MRKRCLKCRRRMLWLPTAQVDRWACQRCQHSEEAPATQDPHKRADSLVSGALSLDARTAQASADALAELGPVAIAPLGRGENLARTLMDERYLRITLPLFAGVVIVFGILPVPLLVDAVAWTGSLVLLVLGIAGVRMVSRESFVRQVGDLRNVAERAAGLAGIGDIRHLLRGCRWDLTIDVALHRLSELAEAMSDQQVAAMDSTSLYALAESLAPPVGTKLRRRRYWPVSLIAARILARTGFEPALPRLREITHPLLLGLETPREVREVARQAIVAIEARAKIERDNRSLLRAASAADPDTSTLLRPAGAPDVAPEQLLRAPGCSEGDSGVPE